MSEGRASLRVHVDAAEREERQRAMRLLLQQPLLCKTGNPEGFGVVRRHVEWLREWFARHPGWTLFIDSELARLVKTPGTRVDASHPATEPLRQQPFGRRRYVVLCLMLATLERAGRQITLRRLAEDTQAQLAGDPVLQEAGIHLDPARRDDRGDLVAVGRLLLFWNVIERVHGDEESYLDAGGDCLYTVHRAVLARLLSVRRGPSTIDAAGLEARLAELQHEPGGSGEEEQRRALRRRLFRLLLERPVVYESDLTEEARAYLRGQRHAIVAEICEATGLTAEIRREGIALVDDRRELADSRMPQEGTDGHAALLLAGFLAAELRRARAPVQEKGEACSSPDASPSPSSSPSSSPSPSPSPSPSSRESSSQTPSPRPSSTREGDVFTPMAAIEQFVAAAAESHGKQWRRDARTVEGATALAHDLVARLAALDLVRVSGNAVRPLPALARYGLSSEEEAGDGDTDHAPPRHAPAGAKRRAPARPEDKAHPMQLDLLGRK